ncbi:MAG: hypothetical protein BWY77_01099 [bacterium ADurb.Bin431]|nr:MAG: hypothetical protein BWY77_01099 [bacterium ADurb.Bin431]
MFALAHLGAPVLEKGAEARSSRGFAHKEGLGAVKRELVVRGSGELE